MRTPLVALLAAGLAVSPIATTAANAAGAAPLSLAGAVPTSARAGGSLDNANSVEGVSTWIWVALGVAVIVAIILIADDNHNGPSSP